MNDNVRKIFDMLGVEPNEKFKCYTKDGAIVDGVGYINEELVGYQIVNGEETYVEDLLCNILNGLFTIIKLPKEPKKKKLRDLTEEEYKKWINKNCNNTPCDSCNLNNVACNMGIRSWIHHKDLYSDKFLDKEIEVEE